MLGSFQRSRVREMGAWMWEAWRQAFEMAREKVQKECQLLCVCECGGETDGGGERDRGNQVQTPSLARVQVIDTVCS